MYAFKSLRDLALYIHVPFCRRKCFYCDFFSVAGAGADTVERVVTETIAQGRYLWEKLGAPLIRTVYLGGGTPSCLPPAALARLFDFVGQLKKTAAGFEFTVEANPESLTPDFIRLCRDYGVNRLSVGIQTCQATALKLLGRLATPEVNRRALELLKAEWPGRLNLDLIAGLPGQTEAAIEEDLLQVLNARPGHISAYALTIEAGTGLARQIAGGELVLAPAAARDELWFYAAAALKRAGFVQYEISNFALPGEECRHNLTYWQLEPYLGLGPGAVSTLPLAGSASSGETGTGGTEVIRLENPCAIADFLTGREHAWGITAESIAPTDFFIENLMMGWRLKKGIARESFVKRFRLELPSLLAGLWPRWQACKYLPRKPLEHTGHYRLTAKGRLFLNTLITDVIGEKEEIDRLLAAVPLQWP